MKNSRKKINIFSILRRVSFDKPKFSFWLFLFVFMFLSFSVLIFQRSDVLAWTPPADPPPADNVPMPLNVGPSAQGKLGNLGIGTSDPGSYPLKVEGESYFTDIITGTSFYGPGGYYLSPGSSEWGLYTLGSISVSGTTNDNYLAGNLGIGTSSPSAKLVVRQAGTDDIFNLYDTDTKVLTVVDGGQVGIGTDTPSGLLDVAGSLVVGESQVVMNVPLNLASAGDISLASDLQFTSPSASYIKSYAPLYLEAGDSNYSYDLTLRAFNQGEVVVDGQMNLSGNRITNVATPVEDDDVATKGYIDNAGNWELSGSYLYPADLGYSVGIGTDTPGASLEVYKAGASSEMLLKSDAGQKSIVYFEDGQTGIYEPADSEDLRFWVGSDDRMTITADGKVGIGTTEPGAKLQIYGGQDNIFTEAENIRISAPSGKQYANISFFEGSNQRGRLFMDTVNDRMTLAAINNMGLMLSTDTSGSVTRPRLYIRPDGKVGINKVDPGTALDVDGVITATDGTSTNWNAAYGWGDHSLAGYIEEVIAGTGLSDGGDSGIVTVNLSTPVSVTHGGTGATSLTANKLLVGAGTNAITSPTNLHWDNVNSRLGIGSAIPNYTLDVNGTIYATGFYYDDGNAEDGKVLASINDQGLAYWKSLSEIAGVTGSGTADYIPKWDATGDGLEDSVIYESTAGNVGIGTTVPYENLNIMRSGAGNVARFGDNVSTKGLIIAIDSSGNPILKGTSSNQPMTITPDGYLALETDGVERVRILQSNGNVGIGTTVPDSQLHINNGLVSVRNTIDDTYQTPTEDYHLTPKGYVDDAVDIVVAADDYIGNPTPDPHEAGAPLDMGAHTLSGNSFSVPASGYTYFTSGNVGIGTLTPTSPLHVEGRITADNLYLSGGCCGTGIHMNNENLVAVNTIQISDPGTSEGARWIWGGTNATIDVAPYVDANSDGYLRFINDGGILLRDTTSGTGRVIVDTDMGMGIGIGDTIPSYTLDVSGTGRFTGNVIVASPSISSHAATKGYVDDNFTPITTTLTMTGTTNQVSIVPTGAQDLSANRAWTFSLPQNIHTSATPQFARLGLGVAADSTYLLNLNGTKMHGTGAGIGIGTTEPYAPLDVYKNVSSPATYRDNAAIIFGMPATTSGNVFGYLTVDQAGDGSVALGGRKSGISFPPLLLNPDGGNVGIGTTTPSADLHVKGDLVLDIQDTIANDMVLTAGSTSGTAYWKSISEISGVTGPASSTDNAIARFDGTTGKIIQNSGVIIDDSGNVGIGTGSPITSLHVAGEVLGGNPFVAAHFSNTAPYYTSSGQGPVRISLGRVNNLHGYIEAGSVSDSNSASGYLAFGNRQNTNEINEVMRFDEGGNVGIGTDDPATKLDINGNVEADNLTLSGRITSGTAHVTGGATINNAVYQSGYGVYVGGSDDNYFAGNVGIGTTGPSEKLHVIGDMIVSGGDIYINYDGATNSNNEYFSYDDGPQLGSGGTFHFHADSARGAGWSSPTAAISAKGGYFSGNVGINTTDPRTKLEIFNDSTGADDLPIGGSRSVGLLLRSDPSQDNTRPGIVQYGMRTPGGIAYSINTAYIGSAEANLMQAATMGAYGSVGATSHSVSYMYLDSRSDGSYNNATLKVDSNDRVGIGISGSTRPSYTLDVSGTGRFTGNVIVASPSISSHAATRGYVDDNFTPITTTLTMTGTTNQVSIVPTGAQDLSANRAWTFSLPQNIHTSATPQFARLGLGVAADSTYLLNLNGTKMHGTGTGIGIGTTIPGALLDISGGTGQVVDVSGGRIMGLNLIPSSDSEAVPRKYLHDNFAPITGGAGSAFVQDGNTFGDLATLGTNDNYDLTFETNGSRKMTILAGGNVGIGTTSPSDELVVGSGFGDSIGGGTAVAIGDSSYSQFAMGSDENNYGKMIWDATNKYLRFQVKDTGVINDNLLVFNNGNVGIGTTNPTAGKLQVHGGNIALTPSGSNYITGLATPGESNTDYAANVAYVNAAIEGGSGSTVGYWTASGDDIYNSNTDKVGIGTTVPVTKLDVNGNVEAGNATLSGRITSGTAHTTSGATINNATYQSGYGIYVGGTDDNYFAGKVGVGTTAPTGQMHISTATDIEVFRAEDETGTEAMVIDKDGNVIISL